MTDEESFMKITCDDCAVPFGVTPGLYEVGVAYCPNGHLNGMDHLIWTTTMVLFANVVCAWCTAVTGLNQQTAQQRKTDREQFYCCNGHKIRFCATDKYDMSTVRVLDDLRLERKSATPAVDTRVGDADRDRCMKVLESAFVSGHLSQSEWDERMSVALTAVTHTGLKSLIGDLPLQVVPRNTTRHADFSIVGLTVCMVLAIVLGYIADTTHMSAWHVLYYFIGLSTGWTLFSVVLAIKARKDRKQ